MSGLLQLVSRIAEDDDENSPEDSTTTSGPNQDAISTSPRTGRRRLPRQLDQGWEEDESSRLVSEQRRSGLQAAGCLHGHQDGWDRELGWPKGPW
jgi:hypothetical protein